MSDELVDEVVAALDPTPASEAAWPVSRRRVLQGLASVGALSLGPGGVQAQPAGSVSADKAFFSNYDTQSTPDGYEWTIDGTTYAFDGSDEIELPNGNTGTELVGPSGKTLTEIIDPAGNTILGSTPDSEADSKLAHRWLLNDVSGSVKDSIGGADGTNNGVTSVSGDWAGRSAADSGSGDNEISTTTLGSYGSNLGGEWALAFSIQTTDTSGGRILSAAADPGTQLGVTIGVNGTNQAELLLEDDSGNFTTVYGTTNIADDTEYRVVINNTGNSASGVGIWVNQTSETTTTAADQGQSGFSDFDYDLLFFARNFDGSFVSHLDGVLNDICLFDDSLTQTEIQSYQNPWP